MAALRVVEEPLDAKYELQSTIGVGAYGKALLAVRKEDKQQVVIKQILLKTVDDAARQEALREAQVLAQFDHVNIVHYYECVLQDYSLNIVMEYAPHGDIAGVIAQRAQEKRPLPEDEIMFWFVQIVLALYHVHSRNVLHRDLKSQNIFIAEDNILKLGDFGIARVLNSDTELVNTVIGTPYYLSPEMCEDRPYNRKSDVWALGCILYELCTLKRAFTGQSLPALVVQILRGRYPPVPTRYSSPLRGLVEAMLKQNPKERPSVDAILRMSYVRKHVERYAQHVMALSPLNGNNLPGATGLAAGPALAAAAAGALQPSGSGRLRPAVSNSTLPKASPSSAAAAAAARQGGTPAAAAAAAKASRTPPSRAPVASTAAPAAAAPATPAAPSAPASSNADGVGSDAGAADGAGGKLSTTGWMRQQQAALAELEGAFAKHQQQQGPGGRRQAAAPAASPAQSDAPSPAPPQGGQGAQAAPPAAVRADSGDANARTQPSASASAGPAGVCSMGGGAGKLKLANPRHAAREAELEAARRAVQEERARKAQAASKRSEEAAQAARQRAEERARELERQVAESKAKAEEKAARSAEKAAQIKNREEGRAKLREQLAQHMAAHQHQIRAVKPRINRADLEQLGAQFAARIAATAAADASDTSDPSLAANNNHATSLLVLVEPERAHSAGTPSRQDKSRVGSGKGAASGTGADKKACPAPASAAKAAAASPPPWKAQRPAGGSGRSGGAGGFPEVQIFTPFGSEIDNSSSSSNAQDTTPAQPANQPIVTATGPRGACAGINKPPSAQQRPSPSAQRGAAAAAAQGAAEKAQGRPTGHGEQLRHGVSAASRPVTPGWGSHELLGLLSELQAVLTTEADDSSSGGEEEEGSGQPRPQSSQQPQGTPGRPPRAPQAPHGADAAPRPRRTTLELPPELPEPQSQAQQGVEGRQGVGVSKEGGSAHGGEEGGGEVVSPSSQHQRVEAIRIDLERQLGHKAFLQAYNYLRELQQRGDNPDTSGKDTQPAAAAAGDAASTDDRLAQLLCGKLYLARHLQRLITWEDLAFAAA